MVQYSFDCLQQVMASPPTVGGGTTADSRDPFDVDEGPAGGEEDEADLGAILRTAYTSGSVGGGIIPSSSRPLSRSDTSSVDEGEPGKCLMQCIQDWAQFWIFLLYPMEVLHVWGETKIK